MDVTVSTANMTSALCKHLHRQHVSTKLVNGDGIIENRFAMVPFLAIVSTLAYRGGFLHLCCSQLVFNFALCCWLCDFAKILR